MRTLRKTLSISSLLLQSSITHKPFSSSSTSLTSVLLNKLKTLTQSPESPIPRQPISNPSISNETHLSDDPKSANLPIPISQNYRNPTPISQSNVVDALLELRNRPRPALDYLNWAEKQPGLNVGFESICVLFHILAGSNYKPKKKDVKDLISSQHLGNDAAIVVQGLIETAKRFEFHVKPRTFELLMNGYVTVYRLGDAIVCFNAMIDNLGTDSDASVAKFLLRILVSKGWFKEVEGLLNKIVSSGVTRDANIISLLMKSCVINGKSEEAERLFRKAKDMGFELGAKIYSCVVGVVCKKSDSDAACELLKEMRGKGWVPSNSTFKNVIIACVQQRKMAEAIRVKDEMVSCGQKVDLVVVACLMRGYCELGDLVSALSLFSKSIEDGLSPSKLTFLVLIKGCCNKGDMEGASELCNLMIKMGFKPGVYITFLVIKGFLDVQSWDKACEQLKIAVESGVINYNSYKFLMSWLCAEGKVDEVRQLWYKIVETGSIPTVISGYGNEKKMNVGMSDNMVGKDFKPNAVTYTILMGGHFKKGEVEKALKVLDEMVSQRIVCDAYTYNTIIYGLCYNGQTSEARKMQAKFTEGEYFKPTFTTYNFIIDGFTNEDNMDSASSVYAEMSKKGVSQNLMLRKNFIDKLCNSNKFEHVLSMIKEMVDEGSELDLSAYEALIGRLCHRGSMGTALNLYFKLLDTGLPPSQYILNCMIGGFRAKEGKTDVKAEIVFPKKKKNKKKTEQ